MLLGIQVQGAKSRPSLHVRAEPSVERPIPETVAQHAVDTVHMRDVSISITIQLERGKFSARHIRDDAELPFRGIHPPPACRNQERTPCTTSLRASFCSSFA